MTLCHYLIQVVSQNKDRKDSIMSVSITCRACGKELSAETEEELAQVGMEHGAEHGHPAGALSHENVMKRLHRHGKRDEQTANED